MAIRRFGPVLGAGVQLTEKEGDQQILPAPTGVSLIVGEFEKGIPGEPAFLAGVNDFRIRNGGRLSNAEMPQAAEDFYKLGRGSGELITYRVTAGDEQKSQITLYTRQGTSASPSSGRKILGRLLAKSGGRWAGRRKTYVDEHAGVGDLTATTLDTGDTMIENEWVGGTLELKKVTTKTYRIVGNTAAGVISVEADQDLLTDFGAGVGTPVNRYALTRQNLDHLGDEQSVAVKVVNGEENPTSEFGLVVYEDGAQVKEYLNLSADPAKVNFWETVINNDSSNYWFTAVDDFVGDATVAAVRPANFYGISKTLTSLILTLPDPDAVVNSVGGADPTFVMGALGSKAVSQVLTGTVGNAGADMVWTSDIWPAGFSVTEAGFTGVATDLGDEAMTVTVTNGGTALADGDTVVITILALEPDELIGGKVVPDVVNEPNLEFTISDNSRNTVSVRTGLDLTNDGGIAAGAQFMLKYAQEFEGGHDGSAVTDSDYLAAFDVNTSTLNKIVGKNKGLVKMATPGLVSTVVTKAGLEYAAGMNFQFKVEIPAATLTESGAIDYINTTIGRSDYGVTHFPTFGYVLDPDATPGASDVPLKRQTLIGMILGREALTARNFDGYHKAPSDITVDLPAVLELTTGDSETATVLNEELTNPQGINLVKFRQGTVILWGDRTISPTSEWKWHHQRALFSHYENILRENFDWIIFALNNADTRERLGASLRDFFLKEFNKGALYSEKNQFEGDAFKLKIDSENNTASTMADGDLNAELILRLVDTVERLKIIMGKAGIFDSAA